MAITLTAGTSVEGTASATSTVVTLPAGLVDGDYTIIFVSCNATSSTINIPANWTELLADTNSVNGSTSMSHAIFYRKWVTGDGNVTVTHSNGRVAATPVKVSGADPGTFVNTTPVVTQAASNALTLVAPTITPTSTHLVCVFTGRRSANGAFLTPFSSLSASMTQIAQANGKATGATNAGHLIAYETVTANSATGTRQANAAGTTTGAFGVSFAINEATGGPAVVTPMLETFESGLGIWTPTTAGSGTTTNSTADTHQSVLGIGATVPATTVDKAGFSYTISPGVEQVAIEGWWRVSAEGVVDSNVPFCRFDWGTTRVADVYRQNQIATGFNLWLRVTKADGIGYWYIPFGKRLELNEWAYIKVVWGTNGIPYAWVDGVQYLDASDAPADHLVTTTINKVWLGSPEAGNQGTWSMDNVTLTTISTPITPLVSNGGYGQFSGAGTLSLNQTGMVVSAPGTVSGAGTLSTSRTVSFSRASALSGSGTLSSSRVVAFTRASALTGSGTLSASGTASTAIAGTANFTGTGTLSSTRTFNINSAASLSGSGTLSTTRTLTAVGSAGLTGSGTLSTSRTITTAGTAVLSSTGTLSAVGVTSPGGILNIGPGAGQNHFDVQIAPTDGSPFEVHTMAEIAAGYSDPEHFYTSADGQWVVFRPRADGATTSGSAFARDELREVDAAGDNITFDALTGEHIISGRTKITHVPANDPDVVIAQLHNGDNDRIAIRTQMFANGTVVLGVRINGSLHATRFQNPFVLGSEFDWKIRLIDGVAEIYYNDMVTPLITSSALVQTSHPDGWYWKTGAYNQFNEVDNGATGLGVSASEYSEVHLKNLQVIHVEEASFTGTAGFTSSGTLSGYGAKNVISPPTFAEFDALFPSGVRTIYVATNGNDTTGAGSSIAPYLTLQKALDGAQAGDRILMRSGTYAGCSDMYGKNGTSSAWITIRPENPGDQVILDGTNNSEVAVLYFQQSSYFAVFGLEVRATETQSFTDMSGIAIFRGCHHGVIWNNRVHDLPGGGINCFWVPVNTEYGIPAGSHDLLDIQWNTIWKTSKYESNNTSGISINESIDSGLPLWPDGYAYHVKNNYIFDVQCTVPYTPGGFDFVTDGNGISIDALAPSNHPGIVPDYTRPILVENNILTGIGGRGVHVHNSKNVTIRGNVGIGNLRTDSPAINNSSEFNSDTDISTVISGNVILPRNTPNWSSGTAIYQGNVVLGGTQPVTGSNIDLSSTGYTYFLGPLDDSKLLSEQPRHAFLSSVDSSFNSSVSLSGSGTLSSSRIVNFSNASALSGSGTLSTTRTLTATGSAALSGSGTLSSSRIVNFSNASALSGSGTLSTTRTLTATGSAALSGSGTLSSSRIISVSGIAGLSGTGVLAANYSFGLNQTANFSTVGNLSAASTQVAHTGTANFTGTGTLNSQTQGAGSSTLNASAIGTLSAATVANPSTNANVSGSGTLSTQAILSTTRSAAVSGSGTLLSSNIIGIPQSVSLSATGTVSTTTTAQFTRAAGTSGSGTLSTTRTININSAANLNSFGTLTAVATSVSQTENANFSATSTLGFSTGSAGSATLSNDAEGTLSTDTEISTGANATLAASAQLSVSTTVTIARTSVLTATGNLTAAGIPEFVQVSQLTATGVLSTITLLGQTTTVEFSSSGVLSAEGFGATEATVIANFSTNGQLSAIGSNETNQALFTATGLLSVTTSAIIGPRTRETFVITLESKTYNGSIEPNQYIGKLYPPVKDQPKVYSGVIEPNQYIGVMYPPSKYSVELNPSKKVN